MSEQPGIEVTVVTAPEPVSAATVIPAPAHNEIALDFLQKEIQEVETDVKDLRQCVTNGQNDTDSRLAIVETVLDHLVARISDLIESAEESKEPEVVVEEDNPPLPDAPKVRKKDKPPRQGNSVRRVFLGRSGGVYP